MRGKRAKLLRKQALWLAQVEPSRIVTGYYGKTFIHGGAKRKYRQLKREWARG